MADKLFFFVPEGESRKTLQSLYRKLRGASPKDYHHTHTSIQVIDLDGTQQFTLKLRKAARIRAPKVLLVRTAANPYSSESEEWEGLILVATGIGFVVNMDRLLRNLDRTNDETE